MKKNTELKSERSRSSALQNAGQLRHRQQRTDHGSYHNERWINSSLLKNGKQIL